MLRQKPSQNQSHYKKDNVQNKLVKLKPGKVGLKYRHDGQVTGFIAGTQEALYVAGINKNWKIVKIDSEKFTSDLLQNKARGLRNYTMQFIYTEKPEYDEKGKKEHKKKKNNDKTRNRGIRNWFRRNKKEKTKKVVLKKVKKKPLTGRKYIALNDDWKFKSDQLEIEFHINKTDELAKNPEILKYATVEELNKLNEQNIEIYKLQAKHLATKPKKHMAKLHADLKKKDSILRKMEHAKKKYEMEHHELRRLKAKKCSRKTNTKIISNRGNKVKLVTAVFEHHHGTIGLHFETTRHGIYVKKVDRKNTQAGKYPEQNITMSFVIPSSNAPKDPLDQFVMMNKRRLVNFLRKRPVKKMKEKRNELAEYFSFLRILF